MKLKFYILFALCFMLVNGASAQGYTVSRVGKTDTIMVTVSGDCSIPVSVFATALKVQFMEIFVKTLITVVKTFLLAT